MLTETTLAELRNLITSGAPAERRAELSDGLDDLQRTIAAQALAIRNLTANLRNRRVGQVAMDAILPPDALDALLAGIGEPRPTPFSLEDARKACAELADQSARAADIGEIAAGVVKVVRAFV